jgi:4-alpha-glucanotransferase
MYTGTHDNMTVVEWYHSIDKETKKFCKRYLKKYLEKVGGNRNLPINWKMIQVALSSPCQMAIIPIQDYLGLGAEGRMNIPGTPEGNWEWKMKSKALNKTLAKKIKTFTKIYDR